MSAPTLVMVWTPQCWRPMGTYHRTDRFPGANLTDCGIQTLGHGFVTSLDAAVADARRPCPTCYTPQPVRAVPVRAGIAIGNPERAL